MHNNVYNETTKINVLKYNKEFFVFAEITVKKQDNVVKRH